MVMAPDMTMVMIALLIAMMTGRFGKVCCAGPLFPDLFRPTNLNKLPVSQITNRVLFFWGLVP